MKDLLKRAFAECLGTFVLVFVACGVAAATGGELVATSLAFGLVIVAMAHCIDKISGCHINPAVSLGCLLTKRMSVKEFLVYCLAQVLGAIAGATLVFGLFKMSGAQLAGDACNAYVNGTSFGSILAALLTEVVLTCIFVFVILNVTDKNSEHGKLAGIIIGLTLTLVHLIGINLTGTSVNPARSIGTALAALIYNGTTQALAQVWLFVVAPLAGAALAALLFNLLHKEKASK